MNRKPEQKSTPYVDEKYTDAQIRLILAAESLFAREGIDGVSVRRIAAQAGHGNNNAVKYHFGDRTGLVLALLAYRITQMEGTRAYMLREAGESGRLDDMATLVRIYCLPHLELRDENGQYPYARFVLQFLSYWKDEKYEAAVSEVVANCRALSETQRRMVSLLPGPTDWSKQRLIVSLSMFLSALVRPAGPQQGGLNDELSSSQIDDLINMITAAISVPLPNSANGLVTRAAQPSKTQDGQNRCDVERLSEQNRALQALLVDLSVERLRCKENNPNR